MSRPLRIEFNNAGYHVMNRGSGGRVIFKTDEQREYFIALLSETHERYNADWHAYCLMENHYHLMIRTPEGNLQRIMRHINGVYTQYYNRQEKSDGALFRGRYKAILVEADVYWLQLSRYIHRNPVEAQRVKNLLDYRWSSYPAYIGQEQASSWLTITSILEAVGGEQAYGAFINDGVDEEIAAFYAKKKQLSVLGSSLFRQRIITDIPSTVDQPDLKRARRYPRVEEIVQVTVKHFKAEDMDLYLSTRGKGVKSPARSVAMYLCQEVGGLNLSKIAEAFGLSSYASAGSTIRNVRLKIKGDVKLNTAINLIKLDLTPSSSYVESNRKTSNSIPLAGVTLAIVQSIVPKTA